jgi:hypothetical protein
MVLGKEDNFCGFKFKKEANAAGGGTRPWRFLIFAMESSASRLKKDLGEMCNGLTKEEKQRVQENLRIATLFEEEGGPTILNDDAEAVSRVAKTIEILGEVDSVFLDPWSHLVEGNINDQPTTMKTLTRVRRAIHFMPKQAYRPSIVVAAHATVGIESIARAANRYSSGGSVSGSKQLSNAARCAIALWPGHPTDPNSLVMTCDKVNDAPEFAPRGIRFNPTTWQYILDPAFDYAKWLSDLESKPRSAQNRKTAKKDQNIALVEKAIKGGISTKKKLDSHFDEKNGSEHPMHQRTIARHLESLVSEGRVSKDKKGVYKPIKKPFVVDRASIGPQ